MRPDRGRVTCGEEVWLDTDRGIDVAPERRRCGYVFQEYALFAHLRVWQNVAYPLRGLDRAERRRRALALLDRFGDRPPRRRSGRGRCRAASASASRSPARSPAGPRRCCSTSRSRRSTRACAPRGGRELAAVLAETGVPALLVTHDFTEAALLGDRVGVIDGGRVIQEGTAAELAASPASAFVADFTGAVVLTGTARVADDGLTARGARRRRHGAQHRARRRPGRGQRLPVGDRALPAGHRAHRLRPEPPRRPRRVGHRRRQPRPRRARRAAAADRRAQRRLGARARPRPGRGRGRHLEGVGDAAATPVIANPLVTVVEGDIEECGGYPGV